jgi:AcrR family transcriptional regulator
MRTAPTRADRQASTRLGLLEAAERLFEERGYAATSLDAVADAAGYTKGAVYSNFASKEDLFFAIYERRVERLLAEVESATAEASNDELAAERVMESIVERREGGDGWLAVFLEFWTHVLRHPEHRERFAAIHSRAIEPIADAIDRIAAEQRIELPGDARQLAIAAFALTTGLGLERLTAPDVVAADLPVHMRQMLRAGMLALSEKRPGKTGD